ncbi:hypothetical protein N7486_006968 [Penicillium sp. IBT 16267x]|nr:hypothetical protein N7486_006968 [Penicillium sp. IBT 16267x]
MKITLPTLLGFAVTAASANLHIQTSSGTVQGGVNGTYPHVRQFLGIPVAQPPVGERRWLPPQSLPASATTKHVDVTKMPLPARKLQPVLYSRNTHRKSSSPVV